ncbi:MAG: ROK family protein [Thermoplasmata archaeon]
MPSRSTRARSPKSERPPPAEGPDLTLGIDLGATKVISGLVNARGEVIHHSGRHLHANDGPDGVISAVLRAARTCLDWAPEAPRSVGVAVAAQVDPQSGTVIHAPNLGWRNVPLGSRLARELGTPVSVVNDARAATYAEWKYGAGRGATDLFCLALGTGIGGSAVFNGALVEGGTHAAGEVGHITIVSGGRRCHCPNSGCFEAYVGGWAVGERARVEVRSDPLGGAALIRRAGTLEQISAHTVFQEFRAGDPLSVRLVTETEQYLTDGAVSVVNAFNPSVLVMSGGLVAGMPDWVAAVERAVRYRCQPPAAGARVVRAQFAEDAGMIGAASLARRPVPP